MANTLFNPHLRTDSSTAKIMRDVSLALVPAAIGSVIFYGMQALLLILVSVITCVAAEAIWQAAHHETITVLDFSAVVTGILLAFNMSAATPVWVVILASIFAIIVVKQMFGGLGSNVFNPALMGRLFVMLVYPAKIMNSPLPNGVDAVSTATPLAAMKQGAEAGYSLLDAFIGRIPGALGETSAVLLLLGFAYLIYKKEVNVTVSLSFFATIMILAAVLGGNPLMHLCTGGVVLGGCFMLTDYNLSSGHGKVLYGIAAGIIVVAIRFWGTFPEGVCFAILIVNCMASLIDKIKTKHMYGM